MTNKNINNITIAGLSNLTNERPGDYYGVAAAKWDPSKRREFGAFLLLRAFRVLLQEGESQLRPDDLKTR